MITCGRCKILKEESEFFKDRTRPTGLHPWCKDCKNEVRIAAQKLDPFRKRRYILKTKYGMTLDDYDKLLAEQGGVCAICYGPARDRWGRFNVDHDHSTNIVRGLLCVPCNQAIGHFYDDPKRCRQAATYLEQDRVPRTFQKEKEVIKAYSDECRERRSEAMIRSYAEGRFPSRVGTNPSDETRQKMSNSQKNAWVKRRILTVDRSVRTC